MSQLDVERMLARSGYDFRPELLEPAADRAVLIRMMRNLISIYQKSGRRERAEMLSSLVDIMLTGKLPRPAATDQ